VGKNVNLLLHHELGFIQKIARVEALTQLLQGRMLFTVSLLQIAISTERFMVDLAAFPERSRLV